MLLIAVDVAVCLLALLGLVLVSLRLWRTVRGFTSAMGAASERIGTATAALEALPRPTPRQRA